MKIFIQNPKNMIFTTFIFTTYRGDTLTWNFLKVIYIYIEDSENMKIKTLSHSGYYLWKQTVTDGAWYNLGANHPNSLTVFDWFIILWFIGTNIRLYGSTCVLLLALDLSTLPIIG